MQLEVGDHDIFVDDFVYFPEDLNSILTLQAFWHRVQKLHDRLFELQQIDIFDLKELICIDQLPIDVFQFINFMYFSYFL